MQIDVYTLVNLASTCMLQVFQRYKKKSLRFLQKYRLEKCYMGI